ncbi:DUF4185 domain-containing protein [Stieleria sp. TO1_6]|uniref:DUF4185 domain-containing protein n=1 Tax=Stieleria tagensis TaxID=2956795 RepID=UPI00209A74CD|nr:DUF4185 domain-containing protein [Stieleria tagensis]MCO8124318.1 DUF4185 domain-containing protein [Stieleria tagensis]
MQIQGIERFGWCRVGVVWIGLQVLSVASLVAAPPCRIQIVDQSNGWPVPLVELTTTHHVRFISDNAGVIAFDLPELMNTETWFSIRGHGYSVDKDGFGFAGVRLTPRPGETLTVSVRREMPGKRLGRLTGGGLFAESQKLGDHQQWTEQGILGCDSVQNIHHNGKLIWGWGDTTVAKYPLGRFHMTGATTIPRPLESFQPPLQLRFDYVRDVEGMPRDVAKMPGPGPTWLFGYVSLADDQGRHQLGATYSKINPPLDEYEKGLCIWNDDAQRFDREKVVWKKSDQNPQPPEMPHGHCVLWTDDDGIQWALFGDPFPTIRCRATYADWSDPSKWETIDAPRSVSLAQPGSENNQSQIEPHRGAIAWNEFRQKWVTVFTQKFGDSSALGEIWYAESDSPLGPWAGAVKVVTHDNYTFYNPQLHPGFVQPGSPILLFEGTYTSTFSKTTSPSPRYDYNQVLYRLDLDELFADQPSSSH